MPSPDLPHDYMDRILRAWWQRAPHAALRLAFPSPALRVRQLLETAPATVRRHADGVALVEDDTGPFVAHVELETDARADALLRAAIYGLLLHQTHGLPVRSALLLLESAPELPDCFEMRHGATVLCEYRVEVVQIFRIPAASLCRDPQLAVLAPLGEDASPADIIEARRTIRDAVAPPERGDLLASLYILAGRRFRLDQFRHLFTREELMESVSYRASIEEAFSEGIEKGLEKGIEKGMSRGRLAALRDVTSRLIERRFPGAMCELAPRLERCSPEDLEAIAEATLAVSNPEQLAACVEARLESPSD